MLKVTGKKREKFINALAAIQAKNAIEMWFASQDVLVTSNINLSAERIELTVYLNKALKMIPQGYCYTQRNLFSHWSYSETCKQLLIIRTMDFIFEY